VRMCASRRSSVVETMPSRLIFAVDSFDSSSLSDDLLTCRPQVLLMWVDKLRRDGTRRAGLRPRLAVMCRDTSTWRSLTDALQAHLHVFCLCVCYLLCPAYGAAHVGTWLLSLLRSYGICCIPCLPMVLHMHAAVCAICCFVQKRIEGCWRIS
jgi:hypothetical protein